ncbi:secondary thiamine-phosphate synthase enzyme YjbQ [Shewanella waksmanii]|uniref:secondary thiamine-phosphate synthase enzyme YjbQ n=1 Tax=Shewanella waksmanii TaxID=213783 RepID=UPI00373521E2
MWKQQIITLRPRQRGAHIITDEIEQYLPQFNIGIAHLLLQHTSAGLTLNENADPSVRVDFERYLNKIAPEDEPYYTHTYEGSDDMPAHLKTSLIGAVLSLPITQGRLNLGTWQGIYLCEFRDHPSARRLVLTCQGE